MCAAHSIVAARDFADMVEEGIHEAAATSEVLCVVVWPLPLGVEVAAYRPWLRLFFACVIFQICFLKLVN